MSERRDIPGLIELGYKQVSAKYQIVARLPEGKSGKDALYEAEMASVRDDEVPLINGEKISAETIAYWREEKRRWVDMLGEESAADHYRRVHAQAAGLWVELTTAEFREFKARRGQTA